MTAPPVTPLDPGPPQKPGWRGRLGGLRERLGRMPRRQLWLNLGLAVLLIVALVGGIMLIGNPSPAAQVQRTATVAMGTVAETVTGNGNAASQVSTPVSFLGSGTVTAVDVKPGDTVTTGEKLATIDPTAARAQLASAKAVLAGAEAALAQAQSGPTSVKAQQDALAITQAQQSLTTAQAQLAQAQKQQGLDSTTASANVSAAQKKVSDDQRSTGITVSSGCVPPSPAPTTRTPNYTCESDHAAQSTSLDADRAALTSAQNARNTTSLTDQKAITSAQALVTADQSDVQSAQLAQQADLHPETADQIAGFQATVSGDEVSVGTAQTAVDDTTLTSPQAGVVLAVNGKVGDPASGSSSSGSSSSTSGGSGSGGSGASASSSAASAASSAGSGFVVIANVSQLAVTANIAEADASKIQIGQQAQISFPGTSTTATGSVVQITPQSTVTNNVVLYPITVAVDVAPPGVGVGATADLTITTATKAGVLSVPSAAITTLGDRHTVTVRRGSQDSTVPVQVGLVGDTSTEVTDGVTAGDVLVLPSATGGAAAGGG